MVLRLNNKYLLEEGASRALILEMRNGVVILNHHSRCCRSGQNICSG